MHKAGLQKSDSTPTRSGEQDNNKKRGVSLQAMPVLQNQPLQKMGAEEKEEEPLHGKFITELKSPEAEGLPLQGKFTSKKKEIENEELPGQGKFMPPTTEEVEQPQILQKFTPPTTIQQEAQGRTDV